MTKLDEMWEKYEARKLAFDTVAHFIEHTDFTHHTDGLAEYIEIQIALSKSDLEYAHKMRVPFSLFRFDMYFKLRRASIGMAEATVRMWENVNSFYELGINSKEYRA